MPRPRSALLLTGIAIFVGTSYAQHLTHSITAGPTSGRNFSFNINVALTSGDDWNASTLDATSSGGATIVSPVDQLFGPWTPPFPDTGTTVDTYLISPSVVPTHFPSLAGSYVSTSTHINVSWLDPAGTVSPSSFLAARIALTVPEGLTPTLSPVGTPILSVTMASVTQQGGGNQVINTFFVYSGVDIPDALSHTLTLGDSDDETGTVDLTVGSDDAIWDSSTVTVTTSNGYQIVSPLDNVEGEWSPPASGSALDTYLIDWTGGNDPAVVSNASFTDTSASATWESSAPPASPVTFHAARIGFGVPADRVLSLTPGAGSVQVATINVTSHATDSGLDRTDTFTVYSLPVTPMGVTNSITFVGSNASASAVELHVTSDSAIWSSSTVTITSAIDFPIVTPLDNARGAWNPPLLGDTIDTYVNNWTSNNDLATIGTNSYTPFNANVTWSANPVSGTPVSFRSARIAFSVPFDRQLTLTPGQGSLVAATITVTSHSTNGLPVSTNTFTVYADTLPIGITHTLSAGPSEGDTHSFDLNVTATDGDDWNGAMLTIQTFRGVTITSPDDNELGAWTPPFPDDGNTVDTYLRSPSAPLALPQVILPAYMPTHATVSWIDVPGATAPSEFLAARIALAIVPGMAPTFEPIGDPIAQVDVSSVSQNGVFNSSFTLYSGTATSQITQTITAGPTSGHLKSFDLQLATDTGNHWTHSNLTITAASPYVAIVSPEDNAAGAWAPPVPDTGASVDTYLRSPSNAPNFAPADLTASYTASLATASWSDSPLGGAPTSFTAARVSFDTPLNATLSAIGNVIATITIESFSEIGGDEPMTATFNVYDGVTDHTVTNTLTIGTAAGDDHALNLNIASVAGNPWSHSTVTVTTSSLTTIVSPLDNPAGAWSPPNPDTGTAVDTYLRSPSNSPSFAPILTDSSFTPTSATASWTDQPLGNAPTSFLGARIAIHAPGTTPTFTHTGSVIATITVQSYTLLGGDTPTTNTYTVYDGVIPKVTHTLTPGPSSGGLYSFNLSMSTPPAYDWNFGILTVTTLGNTRIVSPLDNRGGAWTPPYPDTGMEVDTYLRAPSNGPRYKPQRLDGTFTDTFLNVRWEDVQTAIAPPDFMGARIALSVPLGVVPTLAPVGTAIATVEIESSQTGTTTHSFSTFTIYDGITGASVNHVLLAGPSSGDIHSFDLHIATGATNDWNLSALSIATFNNSTIVTPDDNALGPWTPPFPDDGMSVDTYLRSPSNVPTHAPFLVLPMYSPTAAMVTWYDLPGAMAPQSFLAARLAFQAAGSNPTTDPIGSLLATVDIMSTSNNGGGTIYSDSFEVFDGVVPSLEASCTPLENGFRIRVRVLNGREGTTVTLDLDGERAKTLTFGPDGVINTRWNRVHEGTHVVTLTLDSGQTVTAETGCE